MITPLKAGICAYLAAMALVSDAEAQQGEHILKGEKVINVPVTCYPGVDIVKEYKQRGTFKPLLLAHSDASLVAYVDPSDGEMHLWMIVPQLNERGNPIGDDIPCLLDRTMLKWINTDPMKGKTL